MILTKAIVVAMLLISTQAAPVPSDNTSTNKDSPREIFTTQSNHCGTSTFENRTSEASPTVADCIQLSNNIIGDGDWTKKSGGQNSIASYGTCTFGGQFAVGGGNFRIGNEDIRDLIFDSIEKFQWNGLVGARGIMPCDVTSHRGRTQYSILWAIYHT